MRTETEDLPTVRTIDALEQLGVPAPRIRDKVLGSLQEVHLEWLAATPLVFVATSSADGRCDVSPKGDPPGFIQVLDETTVAMPERAGNNRMDGFHNILENPHVGLVCVIPGRPDTMRLNGRATLVTDGPFFDAMTVRGHRPPLALLVAVEEVFFHCPKAFRRARAWDAAGWDPDAVRPYAEVARALWRRGETAEAVRAHHARSLTDASLYPPTPSRRTTKQRGQQQGRT